MRQAAVQKNNKIRAAFVARGTSFHAWCKTEGIDPHNARKAVIGLWSGPKATEILERIEGALKDWPEC